MTKMNNWEKELSNLLTKMSEHYLIDEEFEKELKWFITNALNQQRRELIKKIENELFTEGGFLREDACASDLLEFLTKLEHEDKD